MGNRCCGERGAKRSTAQLKLLEQAACKRRFQVPAPPIGAAGGTASFYALALEVGDPNAGQQWLGKDLQHAFDELEFYEAAAAFRGDPQWRLLDHMIEYVGVLQEFPVLWPNGLTISLDLLVLRSLIEGFQRPRLLDLKIGAKTSSANWKGKSALASWRQGMLDFLTNSSSEGLRLEGFMSPPDWLGSEDPLHDLGGSGVWSPVRLKRARRLALQRMPTSEVLTAFVDFRLEPGAAEPGAARLLPVEHGEAAALDVVWQVAQLLRACAELPVPQKWVGSSVAVTADAAGAPLRPAPGDSLSVKGNGQFARVHIFDWGRSELNTPDLHKAMLEEERQDRASYWDLYQAGIARLVWEAARVYWNSFCVPRWSTMRITVFDFDSHTQNDRLGVAKMALPADCGESGVVVLPLLTDEGKPALGRGGELATITVSLAYAQCPEPSRLAGIWRIQVVSAANLPAGDVSLTGKSSDPFAVVALLEDPADTKAACAAAHVRRAQARTSVVESTLDPTWGEVLEFAVARPTAEGAGLAALVEALATGGLGDRLAAALPPPQELGSADGEEGDCAAQAEFLQVLFTCWPTPKLEEFLK